MNLSTKKLLLTTAVNTAVMTAFFLIKFILLPRIPDINLSSGSDLDFLLIWVPIPLISIIGMICEKHVRFWIIPDFVYCALSFAASGEGRPYGIGVTGLFTAAGYSREDALIDRLLTFAAILLMQLIIKLLINTAVKIRAKKKNRPE